MCISNVITGRSKSCGCKSKKRHEEFIKKNKFETDNDVVYVYFEKNPDDIMICDKEDWEKMKKYFWCISSHGYATTSLNKKHPSFHRMILNIDDPKIQVDHINKNKLDNRKINLRVCNNQKNSFNKNKYITNTSGYKGVYYDKDRNKWRASIMIDGISYKSPKRYDSRTEAYEWYKKMSDKLFGDYSVFISDEISEQNILDGDGKLYDENL